MPTRPSLPRRLRTVAKWPFGIALTSWRYMWRTTPLHRSETPGQLPQDDPPPWPDGVARDDVQSDGDGHGPLFHRVYRVRIRDARMTPEALLDRIASDLNRVAPGEFASFEKVLGDEGAMAVGDEYVVRIPGPWDGPVRVVERTPTSFRFATLSGHLEAGQIRFSARREGLLEFSIESWARAGDRLSNLLYEHLRMSKEIQLHMWTSLLQRVAELSGGRMTGGIEIRTRRVEAPARLNFELQPPEAYTPARGWNADALVQPLPPEPPGDPVAGGAWEVARDHVVNYRMADPAIVRAAWDPEAPLEGRVMHLELRLHRLFSVSAKVLVTRVWDEERTTAGRRARVFGYEYATLRGHVEMGRMDYEVVKWLDDGTVELRIHAHSRASHDSAPWIRLGFRLFGRREQLRFYRRCCERIAGLTARQLGLTTPLPAPRVALREGDAPEIGERLVPRRTRSPA